MADTHVISLLYWFAQCRCQPQMPFLLFSTSSSSRWLWGRSKFYSRTRFLPSSQFRSGPNFPITAGCVQSNIYIYASLMCVKCMIIISESNTWHACRPDNLSGRLSFSIAGVLPSGRIKTFISHREQRKSCGGSVSFKNWLDRFFISHTMRIPSPYNLCMRSWLFVYILS